MELIASMLEALRMVMYCTQLFSARCQAAQLRQAPRVGWDGSAKPVGLDAVDVDATVLHVLHKNPYSVQVVPPRRRRREQRRRVRLGICLIGVEHGS